MAFESVRHYTPFTLWRWCHSPGESNSIDLGYIDILFMWVPDKRITAVNGMIICNSYGAEGITLLHLLCLAVLWWFRRLTLISPKFHSKLLN